MNIKQIISTLLFFPAVATMAQDKFTIEGKLPKAADNRMVLLNYVDSDGKNAKDSALIRKGKFSFSGTTAFANRATLAIRDTARNASPDYQQFYLEKGTYKVMGKDSLKTAAITGAPSQTDYLAYNKQLGPVLEQWRDINQRASKIYYAKDRDTVAFKAIQAEAKPVHARLESLLDSFIFSHPDSYVTVDLVADNKTAVIDSGFQRYYAVMSPRVMNSFTGKRITARYDKAKETALGKAFDFTQEDNKGNSFTLSSLRGKYVLVDFWASWCGPCRAENPNLLKAYQELKDKNFEIVGISLDDSKAAWLKAVEKDGMPWIQVSDLKGWKNEVAVKYGVTAVPQNLLIDPKGVIIGKNLRGEGLIEKLSALMK